MQLTVSRNAGLYRESGDLTLLPATDTARRSYVVALATADWRALQRRHGPDAAGEVDFLTSGGRWETVEGRRVRRVRRI